MFFTLYFIFLLVGLVVCVIFGPAGALVYGFLFVFICACVSEASKTKTSKGRKQIKKNYQREKKIEEYWGTVDWKDK